MSAFHPLLTLAKSHFSDSPHLLVMPLILTAFIIGLQFKEGDERMTGSGKSRAYRAGVAVALVASFLTVWATVVRDDGTGAGFFMVILAIGVGWFSASFRPAGMARTMIGVAIMQGLLGMLIATATVPDGPSKALLFSGFFVALWLLSATFFRVASKREQESGAAH